MNALNMNMILGVIAIIGIGILVKLDLLNNQYASLALGALLGAGATKASDVITIGDKPADPPA